MKENKTSGTEVNHGIDRGRNYKISIALSILVVFWKKEFICLKLTYLWYSLRLQMVVPYKVVSGIRTAFLRLGIQSSNVLDNYIITDFFRCQFPKK